MINDCFLTKISNVLVIGSGGAGLRSAIEASLSDQVVIQGRLLAVWRKI